MIEDEQPANNRGKRWSRIGPAIILVLSLLLLIGWYILRSNHAFVIRQVEETAFKYFDINLQVEGYELEWASPFPLLRFQLYDLSIASKKNPEKPFLRVNSAKSEFNPWELFNGNFRTHPFQFDSAWIYLHTDSLEYTTQAQETIDGLHLDLAQLPSIKANYLDFHQENDYLQKSLWAKFSRLELEPVRDQAGDWSIHAQSDVFFERLVFDPADGGYLMHTPAQLDLHFYLADEGRTLQWRHSTLTIGRNELALTGLHEWADTNRLQFQIHAAHITLEEVRPLLTKKLNEILRDIRVDQPVHADFALEKKMIHGWKDAIRLDFQTAEAEIRYKKVSMSSATLQGIYSNDCDEDGIGDPLTSCITLQQLDGDFFGILPATLQGRISNMSDPQVVASGSMNIDLPRLNSLLREKNKATFARGTALMNFEYVGALAQLVDNPFDDRDIEVKGDAWFDQVMLTTTDPSITSPSLSGHLSFDEDQTLLENIKLKWMGANIRLTGQISNLPEFFFYEDKTLISKLGLHFDQVDLNQLKRNSAVGRPIQGKGTGSGRRLEELTRQIANNLNGQIQLQIDTLLYDTLFLADFSSRIRLYSPRMYKHTDSTMVQIDKLTAKYMGRTPVYARLEVSGNTLPELMVDLHLPSAVRPLQAFLPTTMTLSGGRADLELSGRGPLRSLLSTGSIPADFRYRGLIRLDQIDLEQASIPQVIRKISGPVRFDNNRIALDSLRFQYDNAPFFLRGRIDDYVAFGKNSLEKAIVDLHLSGKAFDLRSSTAMEGATDQRDAFSPPELFRSMGRLFRYATGQLDLTVDQVAIGSRLVRPFHLEARLLPDDAHPDQHQVSVDSFHLGFGANNYFKGSALVSKPENPSLEARVNAQLGFEQLGKLLPSEYIEMRSGDFTMDLNYSSPLHDTLTAENYVLNARIKGRAEVANGQLFYNYRDFTFNNISGQFRFDQQALDIRDLDLEVNGNRLIAQGRSDDFFSSFILPNHRADIELEVSSPRFNFDRFTAPPGFRQDSLRSLRKARKLLNPSIAGETYDDTTNTLQQTAGYIDQLLDRGSIKMSTNLKEVLYQDFMAHQVDGRVSLTQDTVALHNLEMKVAGGTLTIAGLISDVVQHQPRIEVSIRMDQNNVREIFRQFNNFGQNELEDKNIKGLISADLQFTADVNADYTILPKTMYGDLQVKLAGGELVGLPLFDKLSGLLFRNRGLDHVILDTLSLHAHIRGSDLYVDDLYLHSSSFDFGVQGRYSLGAVNKTRVLFSIPIGNLFNRHIPLEKMRKKDSKRGGLFNILIEARYKKGKMRFIWKPIVLSRKKYRLVE